MTLFQLLDLAVPEVNMPQNFNLCKLIKFPFTGKHLCVLLLITKSVLMYQNCSQQIPNVGIG